MVCFGAWHEHLKFILSSVLACLCLDTKANFGYTAVLFTIVLQSYFNLHNLFLSHYGWIKWIISQNINDRWSTHVITIFYKMSSLLNVFHSKYHFFTTKKYTLGPPTHLDKKKANIIVCQVVMWLLHRLDDLILVIKHPCNILHMVVHACKSQCWEPETGRTLRFIV